MNIFIKEFLKELSAIDDNDFGDFMRKVNHYLLELEAGISASSSERIRVQLQELKKDVQYHPNWDIESTREKIIMRVRTLDELLMLQTRASSENREIQP